MKWFGILVIALGFIFFVGLTAFETSLPLVQFVRKDAVVTTPVHTMLPPNTKFIAGTGTDGAKFVAIESDAARYLELPRYLWLAKLGAFAVCALGAIGFAFEVQREKLRRLHLSIGPNGMNTDK